MAERVKLSNQLITKVTEALRRGAPLEMAATAAGVHSSTLTQWFKRGGEMRDFMLKFGCYPEGSVKHDWMCAKLLEEADVCHAEVVVRYAKAIDNAVRKGNWSAACWWLDRRANKFFTTQQKVQQEQTSNATVTVYVPDNGRGPKAAT